MNNPVKKLTSCKKSIQFLRITPPVVNDHFAASSRVLPGFLNRWEEIP